MTAGERHPGTADAATQLAALRADRERVVQRVTGPWWIDVTLGLAVFSLLSASSLRDAGAWRIVALGAGLLLLWGSFAGYRRATGLWVSGFRRGRTRKAIGVWLAVYGVVVAVGFWAEFALVWRGAMAVAGAVLGVVLAVVNRWWVRLYAAELREGL